MLMQLFRTSRRMGNGKNSVGSANCPSSPLPGTHRADDPAYMLQGRIRFGRSQELDWLLERATQIHPKDRLTMRQMAWELLG